MLPIVIYLEIIYYIFNLFTSGISSSSSDIFFSYLLSKLDIYIYLIYDSNNN